MAIDCKNMASAIKNECREYLSGLQKNYYLKIIQVEGDDASNAYTKGKKKDCEEIGLNCEHVLLPNNVTPISVYNEIMRGNDDDECCGIILQLPLPDHLKPREEFLIDCILPELDVDGFTKESPFYPCTPAGVIHVIEQMTGNTDFSELTVMVIGRGKLVGAPLFKMLNNKNATVIQAHSKTTPEQYKKLLNVADVIVTATGHYGTLNLDNKPDKDTIIIDCGISTDYHGKLCGDCDKVLYLLHDNITHTPGGMGLITRAMLMKNCVTSIKKFKE